MNLEAIRRLRAHWHADGALQRDLNDQFDRIGFTSAYVGDRTAALARGIASARPKWIKDNVWGMIEVSPPSVRLLDCPVLQRLRGIRQLGLSYLTYPSAEHSRFIHSLGMSFVVAEFLRATESRDDSEPPSLGSWVKRGGLAPITFDDLIHAALLHDVGHMPFSHATEAALAANEAEFRCGSTRAVVDLLDEINDHLTKSISLSETLSLLVVLSDRFVDFYEKCVIADVEAPLRIACLIAGIPPEERLSGVTQIISSASIDADKIDYVTRDAKACGIPVGIDVARIFLRSAFVEVSRDEITQAGLKENPAPREVLFVVNASGVDTLDEITQSRASLYQRIYLHPVTRTAEAVLGLGLAANLNAGLGRDPTLADALGLWSLSDSDLLSRLSSSGDGEVARLGGCLRARLLPKKACVFSASIAEMQTPLKLLLKKIDAGKVDDIRKVIVNSPLEELDARSLRGTAGNNLIAKIREEANSLANRLRAASAPPETIPTSPLKDVVLVGTAYMDRARKDCIVLQNGELLRTTKFTNVAGTQDAFEIVKAVGFVMSDPEWSPLVLIAARTVLAAPMGSPAPVELPPSRGVDNTEPIGVHLIKRMIPDLKGVLRRSGVTRGRLDAAMAAATRAGYFDEVPLLAKPTDPQCAEVRAVSDSLAAFVGQREWQVRPETVAAFINQFPPGLREKMLAKLGQLKLLTDPVITEGLEAKLADHTDMVHVAPLSPSSGMSVWNALRRSSKTALVSRHQLHQSISEANKAAAPGETIILVDDNSASATQARAQILNWSGVARSQWPVDCQNEENLFGPLPSEDWETLRNRPLQILVYAGRQNAQQRLKETAAVVGLNAFLGLDYYEEIDTSVAWEHDLEEFLREVGTGVLRWAQGHGAELTPSQEEFCLEHSFGYGGAGGLLATPTNVPTSTVTALWCPGIHRGVPWTPLLLRQNKLRHLVLG